MTEEKGSKVLELGAIVKAIDSASNEELAALNRIENKLDGSGTQSDSDLVFDPMVTNVVDSQSKDDDEPEEQAPIFNFDAPAPLVVDPVVNVAAPEFNPVIEVITEPESSVSEPLSAVTELLGEESAATIINVEPNPVEAIQQPVTDSKSEEAAPIPVSDSMTANQEKSNELLGGLYEDSKGRLRQENGSFASKKQNEAFQQQKKQDEKNGKKSAGIFSAMSQIVKSGLDKSNENVDAVDSVGSAVGNSTWAMVKEVKGFKDSASEYLEGNNLNSVDGVLKNIEDGKQSVTEKAAKAKGFGKGIFNFIKNPKKFAKDLRTNIKEQRENIKQESETVTAENSSIDTVNQSEVRQSSEQKAESQQEAIAEQTEIAKESSNEIVSKLEDVEDAIIGLAKNMDGGGAGALDMLDDLNDMRRKRKKRRGFKNRKLNSRTADADYKKLREKRLSQDTKPKSRFKKAFDTVDDKGRNLFNRGSKNVAEKGGGLMSKVMGGGKGLLKGAGKLFKPLGLILGAGMVGSALAAGDKKEASKEAGGMAGGLGGAVAGGAAGAAMGSVVPVVGTLIGGVIGSIIGGIGGDLLGREAGGGLYEIANDGKQEKAVTESNNNAETSQVNSTLDASKTDKILNGFESLEKVFVPVAAAAGLAPVISSAGQSDRSVVASTASTTSNQSSSVFGSSIKDTSTTVISESSDRQAKSEAKEIMESESSSSSSQFVESPEQKQPIVNAQVNLPAQFYKTMEKLSQPKEQPAPIKKAEKIKSENKGVSPQIPKHVSDELRLIAMDIR